MQLRKLLQVMRLTAFILLAACLQVAARTEGQNVTLSLKNVPVKQVFTEIQRQTGLNVLVKESLLEKVGLVTIQVQNRPVDEVLQLCFKDRQLNYSIEGGVIVVREKPAPAPDFTPHFPIDPLAPIEIKGRVLAEGMKPVEGVTISVKGSKTASFTNSNGEFTISVPGFNSTLIVTSVGIETKEVEIINSNYYIILVTIRPSQLDQVKIIAYGSTTERLSTGNVTTVKAEQIARQPVGNPLAALQGRVPGMTIVQNTGMPGGSYNVVIRGLSSLTQSNDPLYIVDGVPYPAGTIGTINSTLRGGSPLNYVNNADIESISVLKDADATAIYGSRGANGVVLITTKKGKAGKTKIDLNVYTGIGFLATSPDLMNTQEYIAMRKEAKRNDNAPISSAANDNDINGVWDSTRYTDWRKELMGHKARTTDAQLSISGGNSNSTYLLSAGYRKQTTVMPTDLGDTKASVHFSMYNNSTDGKVSTQLSGSYIAGESEVPTVDFSGQSGIGMAPNAPALYRPDGSVNWDNFAQNPISQLNTIYTANSYNLIGNASISYRPVKGLELKSSFSYNSLQLNEFIGNPSTTFNPASTSITRSSSFGNYNNRTWIIEPQATYNMYVSKGTLNLLAGATFQKNVNNRQNLNGSGYSSDALLKSISAAPVLTVAVNNNNQYKYNAVFGRLNYNWTNKYILSLNGRYDGSSRFGPANQFHLFGSAAGIWIFTEEQFMKPSSRWLNYGKLKVSYGSTGNDKIGEYQFLDLFTVPSNALPYQGITTLGARNLFNPELAWELTRSAEVSVDLGFFEDSRILVQASYFRKRTSNQLLPYSLSIVTGFPSITQNLPALIENTGLELEITSTNIRNHNFTWSSSFNLYAPKNKLVKYDGLATSSLASLLIIGQPMTIQKIYKYAGVDQQTGAYTFFDRNGNKTPTPTAVLDQTEVINPVIRFSGGFNNSFDYKGFNLDFTFYYVKQMGPNAFKQQIALPPGFAINTTRIVLDRWQKSGDNADIRSFSQSFLNIANQSTAANSTKGYGDASYIRLNNLSLAYRLPQSIVKRLKLENLRVYIQGQNLLTISNYGSLDPENMSGTFMPPLRVITAGIQITL